MPKPQKQVDCREACSNTHWWRTEVRIETDNQRLTHSDCQHVHHIHAGCSLWFTEASSAIRCVSTDRSILFESLITTTHDQPSWKRNAGCFNSSFWFHGYSLNCWEKQDVYLKYWFCFSHFLGRKLWHVCFENRFCFLAHFMIYICFCWKYISRILKSAP